MLLIGFVLYAYLSMPLLGIALFGVAIAFLFVTLRPRPAAIPPAPATEAV
jgi:mannose/fructose/N-acetylgalactosamine-specific phosphotransferase system component IIC